MDERLIFSMKVGHTYMYYTYIYIYIYIYIYMYTVRTSSLHWADLNYNNSD